jgi:mannose-6-phosphate isomerase-like protein (cupin superfamily)
MPEVVRVDDATGAPHAELFAERPRVVRLSLAAGEGVAPHSHPDNNVLLYVIEGRLRATVDDEEWALERGELLRFDGRRTVAPTAGADGPVTALVVFAPRGAGDGTA